MESSSTIILSVLTDKVTGYTETLSYFGSEAINRSRIIYNLNNGSYKDSASTSTKRHKVEYLTQKTPVTNTDEGIAYWNGTGYGNLVLYADYGRDADPVASEEYTFVANWIAYRLKDGTTGRATDDPEAKVAVMTVSKSNAASIVFTLTPPGSMLNGYYSRVAMEVYSPDK